jgi:nitroimidazol reductase NimA-like FMN-containing flavoprotein (pyridoxamine 5'-phosphate oxidase superfamily)
MKEDFNPVHSNEECEKMLEGTYHGVLVMSLDDQPYALPMNHAYCDGKFYFHCAATGRKLDIIGRNPRLCYVVSKYYGNTENLKKGINCHGHWESVIAYGRGTVIEKPEELYGAFRTFMSYYGRDDFQPDEEAYEKTRAIVIDVESMTARREYDRNKTAFWTWLP